MTYSLNLKPTYKGIGRPRISDYKSVADRLREGHLTISLMLVSVVLSGVVYYTQVPQGRIVINGLHSPISQAQLEEMFSMKAGASELPEELELPPAPGWEGFVAAAHKVSKIYNFPVNVVLAQGALESARGNSRYSKERNNYLGINAVDSNPDLAYTFENSEQCVVEYMRIIRKNFPEAWEQRDNPEALLRALKVNTRGKMYASDPNYVNKVLSMPEWNIKN